MPLAIGLWTNALLLSVGSSWGESAASAAVGDLASIAEEGELMLSTMAEDASELEACRTTKQWVSGFEVLHMH